MAPFFRKRCTLRNIALLQSAAAAFSDQQPTRHAKTSSVRGCGTVYRLTYDRTSASTTLTAAVPFQSPAIQSGTLSRISSGTRPSVQSVSDVCLKRTCSLDTRIFSALEVTALYKSTYFFYLVQTIQTTTKNISVLEVIDHAAS